jgi:sarcosine oxidase, subunit beta
MNYNVINLLWQGLSGQKNWPQAWRSPELKSRYFADWLGGLTHSFGDKT